MAATHVTDPEIPAGADTISVRRPSDGSILGEIPLHDADQVGAMAERLRTAQTQWEAIGVKQRTHWIRKFRQWLLDNADELIRIGQDEGGRPANEPLLELTLMVEVIDHYTRVAPKLMATTTTRGSSLLVLGKKYTVHRTARPLVGVIGAWNYPLLLTFGDALPALFAGSAVILKPSEVTPLGVKALVRGWREIGAPAVVDVAFGGGETGQALVDVVDFVQFTGSVATGKRVAARAAETVTPVSLELGGKDPLLVLDGANVPRAVNCALYGGYTNNGQVCMGIERVYVAAGVYDAFVDQLTEKVRSLRSGVGDNSDVGALTHPPQIDVVDRQVTDAVEKGARVLTGGHKVDGPGTWFEPTVLVDVDHSMLIMQEETFGPVLPIVKVADTEEAIALANDSDFGLSATVFARSTQEGERVAARLDAGAVNIDQFLANMMCAEVPQSGWKTSGIGGRAAEQGLLKYTRTKVVATSWIPVPVNDLNWFPYTPRRRALFRAATRFAHRRGLARFGL
ncbi:aldehyde dehydrogenase family protein [Gordonia sp. NB41Y]|uniref:aldehyde dehydrogenase family protein n=1 Tax=Gordonia sp. NB41Y TaxID=875808 RepID=UPI0006B14E77|nr:aldehyde dehydrogenase family protein [Gordonia sp. NB41Y]KOY49854.1 hypothetical protein ISGA_221 [Gordonia sp. NB41Y]WLP88687.1 aldehyde dehydrogenase family protein [Gordonia sp. NB41Y]